MCLASCSVQCALYGMRAPFLRVYGCPACSLELRRELEQAVTAHDVLQIVLQHTGHAGTTTATSTHAGSSSTGNALAAGTALGAAWVQAALLRVASVISDEGAAAGLDHSLTSQTMLALEGQFILACTNAEPARTAGADGSDSTGLQSHIDPVAMTYMVWCLATIRGVVTGSDIGTDTDSFSMVDDRQLAKVRANKQLGTTILQFCICCLCSCRFARCSFCTALPMQCSSTCRRVPLGNACFSHCHCSGTSQNSVLCAVPWFLCCWQHGQVLEAIKCWADTELSDPASLLCTDNGRIRHDVIVSLLWGYAALWQHHVCSTTVLAESSHTSTSSSSSSPVTVTGRMTDTQQQLAESGNKRGSITVAGRLVDALCARGTYMLRELVSGDEWQPSDLADFVWALAACKHK